MRRSSYCFGTALRTLNWRRVWSRGAFELWLCAKTSRYSPGRSLGESLLVRVQPSFRYNLIVVEDLRFRFRLEESVWIHEVMSSDTTPLLDGHTHTAVYNRFSESKKRLIVAVVSWAGVLPCKYVQLTCFPVIYLIINLRPVAVFVACSFIPLIPKVAHDLQSTAPIVRWVPFRSILPLGWQRCRFLFPSV